MPVPFGDRAAEMRSSRCLRISRIAGAKRGHGAFNNQFRRREIGIRDSEVDHAFRVDWLCGGPGARGDGGKRTRKK
jgi:hypothetical protein